MVNCKHINLELEETYVPRSCYTEITYIITYWCVDCKHKVREELSYRSAKNG